MGGMTIGTRYDVTVYGMGQDGKEYAHEVRPNQTKSEALTCTRKMMFEPPKWLILSRIEVKAHAGQD